ncbi:MAG: MFS transporter [Phycisphaerae bacterium]|nr:MFS transporter [Phycisphaerae bacterium]
MSHEHTASKPQVIAQRSGLYTIAVALVAGLGGVMFGYDIGVIADAKLGIRQAFGLNDFEIEIVVSAVLAGSFLGALIAGRLCDWIGRRWTNVWGGVMFILGCAGCALAQDYAFIVTCRVVMGLGVGFSSVAGPLYIAEVSAPWNRGALVSLYQLAITIGIFVAFLIGIWTTGHDGFWRLAFGIGGLLGGGLVVGMLLMPPSPRWLVGKGHIEIARAVLKRTMGSDAAATEELAGIRSRLAQETGHNFWRILLHSKGVRLALILAVGLAFLQQMSGINAIFYYAPEILKESGLGNATDGTQSRLILGLTAALGLTNVFATLIAVFLVDKVGRRPLLMVGTALMMLSQIVIAICCTMLPDTANAGMTAASYVIVASIFVAIIAFAFSLGPLVWLAISEIFPANVRSTGIGIATSINWVGNFFVGIGTLSVVHYSPALTFWIFAAFNACTVLFVFWRMPETKGVELEQIEAFFEGSDSRSA